MCATARSGSNFLTDGLHATRKAGRPKQFFLPKFESDYGSAHGLDPHTDFAGYVRGIIPATATSNEVFGFKVMGWYLQDFLDRMQAAFPGYQDARTLLATIFPRLKYLRMVRRNKLRQAISKARALQSGLWKIQDGNSAHAGPNFDFELITQCLRETEEDEAVWQRFFEEQGIVPHTVIYEDLCAKYDDTIRSTLGVLGVKIPSSSQLKPGTVRQSDELSKAWEDQFLKLAPTT
ncbi:MAG: Stf0 family sulfotransferase [Terrimicrobiaceae bacterium]